MNTQSRMAAEPNPLPEDWVMVVANDQLLGHKGQPLFPWAELYESELEPLQVHRIGGWHNRPCFLVRVADSTWQMPWAPIGLRQLLASVSAELFQLASRAVQFSYWLEHHQFCGRCGHKTHLHGHEQALFCDTCDRLYFPRISPCVIGLVWRDKQILLARNSRFKAGYFSILAGFIEPAETAEQALIREVKEEVAVDIHKPVYLCSQAWPFPSQLMLGFFAEYASGEIEVDGHEIVEAAWFAYDQLPQVPAAETIAGALIRRFVDRFQ